MKPVPLAFSVTVQAAPELSVIVSLLADRVRPDGRVSATLTCEVPSVEEASGEIVMVKLFSVPGPPSQLLAALWTRLTSSFGIFGTAFSRPAFWFGSLSPEVSTIGEITPSEPVRLFSAGLALAPTAVSNESPDGETNFTP